MVHDYSDSIREVLGSPDYLFANLNTWDNFERRIGFIFPPDYKSFVDAYGPVVIKGHLYVEHPAVEFRGMVDRFAQMIDDFEEQEWVPEEHQFGAEGPRFGKPGGLYPLLSTDRGERLFSKTDANNVHDYLVAYDGSEDEFFEYYIPFSEWLYRYVIGQDMIGPDSANSYPGPIKLERAPLKLGGEEALWYGPDRDA
ncbi:hypothetical protein [Streptomyces sparsus]